ncbi:P24-capsid [Alphabaculovirus myunipunctae]|uniref:P24-capsid n=1 Tax=Mythimna unipuncta nucleopolyhedrovirus TaxID=447897 RepID=A0A2K9VS44_9ABAC|nr:P24-capsid [Mythimna unipuncta nucleopolyhedrovirus]AUV65273.1 P24-capsid [Mythimna unipuncta nucleopolyhedrovirus]
MYESNNANNINASNDAAVQFHYDEHVLEVVIIENGEDDRDGYVELMAVSKLIAPLVNIRGFNHAVMWANVIPSQRLTRNNKNYVHVFALGRYLSSYRPSSTHHRHELLALKQLICDLIMGAQSQIVDPLSEIKTQLCTLQECLGNAPPPQQPLYQNENLSSSSSLSSGGKNNTEVWRDILRSEHAALFANINGALETIKSMQADLTNKIAFSNDTMLDGFKSIKDVVLRKK